VAILKEAIRGNIEKNIELLEQYEQRLNSALGMLSSLPQFQLSPDFLPGQDSDPLLPTQGSIPGTQGDLEEEEFPMVQETQVQNSHSFLITTPYTKIRDSHV